MEEKQLLALLKSDDPSAMKVFFNRYHAPLCMLACRMVKDADEARDIVQEVFIRLWKNRKDLQINTSLEAYLKRATVNTSLNLLQSPARQRKQQLDAIDPSSALSPAGDHALSFDELTLRASAAIDNLPPRTRTVFTLIRSEEMTYRDVAETLGISLKAVEKEMLKALKLLREALKEYLNPSVILVLLNAFA
jgi:RNA polymerase sigma-70 factor, ECF subfamily